MKKMEKGCQKARGLVILGGVRTKIVTGHTPEKKRDLKTTQSLISYYPG